MVTYSSRKFILLGHEWQQRQVSGNRILSLIVPVISGRKFQGVAQVEQQSLTSDLGFENLSGMILMPSFQLHNGYSLKILEANTISIPPIYCFHSQGKSGCTIFTPFGCHHLSSGNRENSWGYKTYRYSSPVLPNTLLLLLSTQSSQNSSCELQYFTSPCLVIVKFSAWVLLHPSIHPLTFPSCFKI